MATETYKTLGQMQIGNTATTVYTVPALTQAVIKHIVITNPTASDATVKLWRSGVTDPYVILPTVTIVAGGFAEWEGSQTMEAAATLKAISGTNLALSIEVDGLEIS